jgi:hypothetical protein
MFILHSPMQAKDMDEYERLATVATRLKPYGRVLVNISALAEKSVHELPPTPSPWHEYSDLNPTPFKFFPHPKIAGHLPQEHVRKNRELLLAKAAILKDLGLEASFWSYEPNYLPESFYREFPHLRGPRVDHPRRSTREEFAICTDQPEALEMYTWMAAELKRRVPHLAFFNFKTNDAGSGFCWSYWLYSGVNGPKACAPRGVGRRVAGFVEALHQGFVKGGGDLDIAIGNSNFHFSEREQIFHYLPPRTYLSGVTDAIMGVSDPIDGAYPVKELFDPMGIIKQMTPYGRPEKRLVFMGFRASYDRGRSSLDSVEKIVDVVTDCIKDPVQGTLGRLEKLRKFCQHWGGEKHADRLFETFVSFHDNLRLARCSSVSILYHGVAMRLMIRPLVLKPELLTPEEESYFLPHIFNIDRDEARNDYGRGIAGLPITARHPCYNCADHALLQNATEFESFSDAPKGAWLKKIGAATRIWESVVRSIKHFAGAQIIRDRNAAKLSSEPPKHSTLGTLLGDEDNLAFTDIMRDELDNTAELLRVLKNGGLKLLSRADKPDGEDTFVLGPDIIGALEKKIDIMRKHWLDVQTYLAPPAK